MPTPVNRLEDYIDNLPDPDHLEQLLEENYEREKLLRDLLKLSKKRKRLAESTARREVQHAHG